ncbi:hypothetical protein BSKO_13995 [Bryopsis sp. KO-2023]|nr:hypothetical protein BSKO_13995 [Bryopsis sp. KO-2023]
MDNKNSRDESAEPNPVLLWAKKSMFVEIPTEREKVLEEVPSITNLGCSLAAKVPGRRRVEWLDESN